MRAFGFAVVTTAVTVLLLACGNSEATRLSPSPPLITKGPADTTVAPCDSAQFSVEVSGQPPFLYQWLLNGVPVLGANGSSFQVSRAGLNDTGAAFSVMVRNAAGSVTSKRATLNVVDSAGTILLANAPVFGGMAVDGKNVYWTDGLGVNSASVNCSGPVRRLYDRVSLSENTYALVLSPDRVVWSDEANGSIHSVGKEGGQASLVASGLGSGTLYLLTIAGQELFWPNVANGIQAVSIVGGGVVTFPVGGLLTAGGIVADDQYVYWTNTQQGTVNRVAQGGGPVTVLAYAQSYPNAIAAGGGFVYWTTAFNWDTDSPTGRVMKVSREGGASVVLSVQPAVTLQVALDASYVYWTAGLLTSSSTNTGSVSKVALDGSQAAAVIATGLDSPYDLAVDSQYVYWSERAGVRRLAK